MQMKYLNMQMIICVSIQQQSTWIILCTMTDNTWVHCYTHLLSFATVAHTVLWIFAFLLLANQNKYANKIFIMRIQWWQTRWVLLVPTTTHIPSIVTVAHIELWIFAFFVISHNRNKKKSKWAIQYAYSVTTDHVGNTCAYHYLHTKFYENRSLRSSKGLPFSWWETYIHPSIQTAWQLKSKWSFQHSWRPTTKTVLKIWFDQKLMPNKMQHIIITSWYNQQIHLWAFQGKTGGGG